MAYYILKSYKLKHKPLEIFEALKNERNCFFLDSSLNAGHLGRYSFLGIDPFYILKAKNQDPLPGLRRVMDRYRVSLPKSPIPFLGGAVGYLAYDLGFTLEKKLKRKPKAATRIPDAYFGFYNTAIIIDHFKGLLYIFSAGFPEKGYHLAKALCEFNFKKISKLLSKTASSGRVADIKAGRTELKSNFTRKSYILAVKRAKEYIRRGDIYQVNLSQEFSAKTNLPAYQIYNRLRSLSPSSFGAYLDCRDFQILSSSPESFLRVQGDTVSTRPMKGTRPRSRVKLNDLRLKRELLESAKDRAELMMIVDLERNDLGRVCSYDSIGVSALRQLEEYSTVFQTTATVRGSLHEDKDRVDLIRACFPGGSITGCPKIRAMEVIEELEPSRRSVYTGSLGYLSFSGGMDMNVLIRTILKERNRMYFSVGAGIVADSDPQSEYQETLVKAKAMIEAINAL